METGQRLSKKETVPDPLRREQAPDKMLHLLNGWGGSVVSQNEVTERKRAEERLQELSGQLINAQENERRRIARELHDDLNQRLALLTIDLEQLGQKLHKTSGIRKQMQDLCARAREISTDVQRMCYQLHPSKLETLGLVAAVRSLCHEVSERQGLEIGFFHWGVPESISKDVALCLFRVAQESLQNVVKHSGAKQARVEIIGNPQTLNLIISDTGVGFDAEAARRKGGLGLVSMDERLRLVGGSVSIHSQLQHGSRIEVKVPLRVIVLDTQ